MVDHVLLNGTTVFDSRQAPRSTMVFIHGLPWSWTTVNHGHGPGLEKSSVLPVLDRFLSLKTDFVLNRKQKNRSIKVRFFSSNSQ